MAGIAQPRQRVGGGHREQHRQQRRERGDDEARPQVRHDRRGAEDHLAVVGERRREEEHRRVGEHVALGLERRQQAPDHREDPDGEAHAGDGVERDRLSAAAGLAAVFMFAFVACVAWTERRGRRCPAEAKTLAVGAARRLHCAARARIAPQNSLRSLRSLRSDSCGESDDEARTACAPIPALRCSSLPTSPPPGTACRETHRSWCAREPPPVQRRRVRAGGGACLRRREAQGSWPRAQRASSSDLPQLSERSERSERSEFCGRPRDRASQGSRRPGADRRSLAPPPARTRLRRSGALRNGTSELIAPAPAAAGTSSTRSAS